MRGARGNHNNQNMVTMDLVHAHIFVTIFVQESASECVLLHTLLKRPPKHTSHNSTAAACCRSSGREKDRVNETQNEPRAHIAFLRSLIGRCRRCCRRRSHKMNNSLCAPVSVPEHLAQWDNIVCVHMRFRGSAAKRTRPKFKRFVIQCFRICDTTHTHTNTDFPCIWNGQN